MLIEITGAQYPIGHTSSLNPNIKIEKAQSLLDFCLCSARWLSRLAFARRIETTSFQKYSCYKGFLVIGGFDSAPSAYSTIELSFYFASAIPFLNSSIACSWRGVNAIRHGEIVCHVIAEQDRRPYLCEGRIAACIHMVCVHAFEHEGLTG